MHDQHCRYSLRDKRVWVAGDRGLVGSALMRRLASENCEIITCPLDCLDLHAPDELQRWVASARPQAVFLAAAHADGTQAGAARLGEFFHDDVAMIANVVEAARDNAVEKLMYVGPAGVYPQSAPQPISVAALLTGPSEQSDQWRTVAKIAGIKLCQVYRHQYGCDFISVVSSDMYGPCDDFDLAQGSVLPALIARAHTAKQNGDTSMVVLGKGQSTRYFMYADDAADGMVFLMKHYSAAAVVHLGTGEEISLTGLAEEVARATGYGGALLYDINRSNCAPRHRVDAAAASHFGWRASTPLRTGIAATYRWYREHLRLTQEPALASV